MSRTKHLYALCPVCGRKVRVSDPGNGCTPWAVAHNVKRKRCRGSLLGVKPIRSAAKKGGAQ